VAASIGETGCMQVLDETAHHLPQRTPELFDLRKLIAGDMTFGDSGL